MFDLLFENALLLDGSGAPPQPGSLAVQGGHIAAVGDVSGPARRRVDAAGCALSPGWIDSHSHSDQTLLQDSSCFYKLQQGITTEVAGQCGSSQAPLPPADGQPGRTTAQWFDQVSRMKLGTNHLLLVGHGAVRQAVMGFENRAATPEELAQMEQWVHEAMQAGALGLSSGLAYAPGSFAPQSELAALCRVVAQYGGIYATHMQNQAGGLLQSVQQSIDIARQTGCTVVISHHKCIGRPNWGLIGRSLALIDQARAQGLKVYHDMYPYTAGSTTLTVTLPPSLLAGGQEQLLQRLAQPAVREYILEQFAHPTENWENALGQNGCESFLVTKAPATPEAEGKTIAQYAAGLGIGPMDAYFKLLIDNRAQVTTINFVMDEQDLCQVLRHPCAMVGTDGMYQPGALFTHPRAVGTFARYLGRYVRGQGLLPLPEAIRKITGLPAQVYGLAGKGLLRPGMDADLVLFDPETILDHSDYTHPFAANDGIGMVVVGGQVAVENGRATGVLAGRLLRCR